MKKRLYVIIGLSLIILISAVALIIVIPDWTSKNTYLLRMEESINEVNVEYPVSYETKISIYNKEELVEQSNFSYVIENESNAILINSDIYYGEDLSSLSETEEYVLYNDKIYLRKECDDEIVSSSYSGLIDEFTNIIKSINDESVSYDFDKNYFSDYSLTKGKKIILSGSVKNECLKEFFNNQELDIMNMSIFVKMTPKGRIIDSEIVYYSRINSDIKTTINHSVSYDGTVILPDWIS